MADEATPKIKLEPGVSGAIRSFMEGNGIRRPLRVDLNFSGCCDASLCLCVDWARETDLVFEMEGLTFLVSPELYELTGEIIVSYINERGRKGFIVTSSKPLGEWDGFGVSDIKIVLNKKEGAANGRV